MTSEYLTPDRLTKIEPVLDRYRDELRRTKGFCPTLLSNEIEALLDVGHFSVKRIMGRLCDHPKHVHVAVYWIKNFNGTGPSSDLKGVIASAFGADSYDSADRSWTENLFWAPFFHDDA